MISTALLEGGIIGLLASCIFVVQYIRNNRFVPDDVIVERTILRSAIKIILVTFAMVILGAVLSFWGY